MSILVIFIRNLVKYILTDKEVFVLGSLVDTDYEILSTVILPIIADSRRAVVIFWQKKAHNFLAKEGAHFSDKRRVHNFLTKEGTQFSGKRRCTRTG